MSVNPEVQGNTLAEDIERVQIDPIRTNVAAVVKETKAGYKTTEFWGVTAIALLDVISQIPTKDKLVASIVAGAYALARGLAKSGVPSVE